MIKSLNHIKQTAKSLLLVALLCFNLYGHTQEVTAADTLNIESVLENEVVEEEEGNRFQTISDHDRVRFVHRRIDTVKVTQLKKDDDFWYVNEVPPKKATKPGNPKEAPKDPMEQTWLRNLLWVLVIGGFIAILIWFLIASNVKLLRKSQPFCSKQEVDEELSTENLFDIDYEKVLQESIKVSNYRLAVRLLYLQTLKDLAKQNLIQYKLGRTNNDYLLQLFQTAFYKDFFRLTRSFEYIWYGQFPVSANAFASIRQEFSSFKQRIS